MQLSSMLLTSLLLIVPSNLIHADAIAKKKAQIGKYNEKITQGRNALNKKNSDIRESNIQTRRFTSGATELDRAEDHPGADGHETAHLNRTAAKSSFRAAINSHRKAKKIATQLESDIQKRDARQAEVGANMSGDSKEFLEAKAKGSTGPKQLYYKAKAKFAPSLPRSNQDKKYSTGVLEPLNPDHVDDKIPYRTINETSVTKKGHPENEE